MTVNNFSMVLVMALVAYQFQSALSFSLVVIAAVLRSFVVSSTITTLSLNR